MAEQDILQSVYPHIGGQDNVSRTISRNGTLYLMLKDASAVDLKAVKQVPGIADAALERGRLTLQLEEKENSMAQDKYAELKKNLLPAIGGKENIIYFQHCTTRLRFKLKDREKVDLETIKKLNKVLGAQWSNQELQVIIGPAVSEVYQAICQENGLEAAAPVDETLDPVEKKKFSVKGLLTGMMDAVSGSITPLIPMMIGGGMIKVLYMICNMAGILPETSTTYQILYWLGDAFIYFFPVFLGATSAKKFGANQGLGMLLGALLIYPSFIAAATDGASMTIFGLPVYVTNYSSTVIPIIITTYVLSKVEKLISKFIPDFLKSCLVPTFSLVIMLPLMLVITAPLGYYIGTYVANAVIWIYETIGSVGVAVLAALLPLMVMTGMHTMMTPYWTTAFASLGHDPFFLPAMIISNMTQATACLAVGLRAKDQNTKSTALSCAATAYIAGVTEPAMFGVTLRYKRPLYAAMAGNAVGGLVAGLLKVSCYAFPGSGGIFSFVTFVGPGMNFVWFLVATAAAIVTTFALTFVMGIQED